MMECDWNRIASPQIGHVRKRPIWAMFFQYQSLVHWSAKQNRLQVCWWLRQDVEGHEGIVIEGGHITFQRAPYVCMELSPQLQWAKAETPEQEPPATLEWLTGEGGFDIQGRNQGAWRGVPMSPVC